MNTRQWHSELDALLAMHGVDAAQLTEAEIVAAVEAQAGGREPAYAVNLILTARYIVARRAQCAVHIHTDTAVWRGRETDETAMSHFDLMLN